MSDPRADNTSKCPAVAPGWCVCVCEGGGGGKGGFTSSVKNKRRNRHQNCKLFKVCQFYLFYKLDRKLSMAFHGCHCSGYMAVRMRKVLAIPLSCVV